MILQTLLLRRCGGRWERRAVPRVDVERAVKVVVHVLLAAPPQRRVVVEERAPSTLLGGQGEEE